ncbi:MAG: (2Fe-2S)-binding protein [Thermoplasmatota archaeon]
MKKKHAVVCRCEDITYQDVIDAIREGYTDLEELRRKLRIGMGPCQGRVCISLLKKILSDETGEKVPEHSFPTSRPPLVPVSLGSLAQKKEGKR